VVKGTTPQMHGSEPIGLVMAGLMAIAMEGLRARKGGRGLVA
jgi:hypothetical protein